MEIVNTVVIDRPIEEVYDVATCGRRAVVWRGPIVKTEKVTDGPRGVGTAYKWQIHVLGRDVEANPVITAWDPPHRAEYEDMSAPIPFHYTQTFAETDDGVEFTLKIEAEPHGFFQHLAEPLLRRNIDRQEKHNMETLKEMLESETPIVAE